MTPLVGDLEIRRAADQTRPVFGNSRKLGRNSRGYSLSAFSRLFPILIQWKAHMPWPIKPVIPMMKSTILLNPLEIEVLVNNHGRP